MKSWKDMTKEEKAQHLFNKMKSNINETFELLGLEPYDRKADLYTKHILKNNVKINLDDMQQHVLSNYSGFKYPPLELFTKGLGIMSETDKFATACEFAWKNLEVRLPYLKKVRNYKSEDKYLLYALDRVGIERIIGAQEVVNDKSNKINSYELNGIKSDFYKYYTEALKNNSQLEMIEGDGSLIVEIEAAKPNQALLGSSESPLKMIDENVKRIGENIMKEIGR